ncbi:MAG TPA: Rieske 2Fe-2S domain-containing protein [Burkholderiales bacterium]|nr:Rieske 2Fe-2S domain-containing protein [Burkholderiales bacterium]
MADAARVICASGDLAERGKGVRFAVDCHGEIRAAFAIRYEGRVYAYLNSCAHVQVELDWLEGEFFDHSKLYLICATHGATYEPDSGYCVLGPCRGKSLIALPVMEREGEVLLVAEGKVNHV